MNEARPTVIVADGQQFMRAGVRDVLERGGFDVVADATNTAELIAAVRRERPRLCLLDAALPGGGIEAVRTVKRLVPDTIVIVLAGSLHDQDIIASFRAGAAGYLLNGASPEALTRSLRAALRGEAPISRALVRLLIEHLAHSHRRHLMLRTGEVLELTEREWEVAQFLCEGHSTRDIAATLALSPVTVRRHISEIVAKLGATSRSSAVDLLVRSIA